MSRALADIDEAAEALAEGLTAGAELSPQAALRLAGCDLPQVIARALGYEPGPGRRLPRTDAHRARRDELLRQVGRFYSGSARTRAEAISRDWKAYETRTWPREYTSVSCPDRHIGRPQAIYFALLKERHQPRGPDLIRRVLGSESRLTLPHEAGDGESVEL